MNLYSKIKNNLNEAEQLNESYAIINYWDSNGEHQEKIINGSSPKNLETKVKRFVDKVDEFNIIDISQASNDVADSEYLNSLGEGVLRTDTWNSTFEESEEEIDQRLLALVTKKKDLLTDDIIDDDLAYDLIEKIDNELINSYSIEEIEKAEKLVGLDESEKLNEADEEDARKISIGLNDAKSKDIINAVIGQMSDGHWENSPGMERYWRFASGLDDQGNIIVYTGSNRKKEFAGYDRYGLKKYKQHWTDSAFNNMSDEAVKKFFANKIKQIVKLEGLDWNRNNTEPCEYLDYSSGVTVRDAYKVYDRLLGRIDRITDSEKLKESDTENRWDATELDRVGFMALLKFNNPEKHANPSMQYIITNDGNEVYRFAMTGEDERTKDIGAKLEFRRYINKNESQKLKEASNIIWTSETTEDDYDKEDLRANEYQDYLDNFDGTIKPEPYEEWLDSEWLGDYLYNEFNSDDNEYEEWYNFIGNYPEEDLKRYYQDYLDDIKEKEPRKPKDFDSWFEDYAVDDAGNQWEIKEEDLKENVIPMIDKQVNGAIFITGNYNSNYPDFRKSGPGGKIVKDGNDLIDWLSNNDGIEITNENGNQVGISSYDHDGSIGGLLYTLPNDSHKILEIAKSTDYYDENDYEDNNEIISDFMYDLSNGNVSMHDVKRTDLLVPIKNGFLTTESQKLKESNYEGGYLTSDKFEDMTDQELLDYLAFVKEEWTYHTTKRREELGNDIDLIHKILVDRGVLEDDNNPNSNTIYFDKDGNIVDENGKLLEKVYYDDNGNIVTEKV